jgi:repressor LexA
MQNLTDKQTSIYNFVKRYINVHGQSPSLTELMEFTGIQTKQGVIKHLKSLEKKGILKRTGEPRGLKLVRNNKNFINIPILGRANAGRPLILAEEELIGEIQLDENLLPVNGKDIFAVIVKGDSMNRRMIRDKYIEDNSLALIRRTKNVLDGDVVLAIIEQEATIKSYMQKGNMVILYPESKNNEHKPIYISEESTDLFEINGKVVAVLDNPIY